MNELERDLEALTQYLISERGYPSRDFHLGLKKVRERSYLHEAEALRQTQEARWQSLLIDYLKSKGYGVNFVSVAHRSDIDIYYSDEGGNRHYLLRDHISDTPWQDAFDVVRKGLRVPSNSKPSTRIARLMQNAK